jgi:hypothetical protein
MKNKPKGYWTKEKCTEKALKYNNIKDFYKNYRGAYAAVLNNNWLNEVCSHMKRYNKNWTKEECNRESLKYKSRTEFRKKSITAYHVAVKKKIMDEICSHMKTTGNIKRRCIYVYEFIDNCIYVGLTYNIDNRHHEHLNNPTSQIYKKICQNINYERKQLTEYIDVDEAKNLEKHYVDEYRKNGWFILNKAKTGGIGGKNIKWTKEKCQEEALKYDNRSDFNKSSRVAYSVSISNEWLNEICSHMIKKRTKQKSWNYWTKDRCSNESIKYKNRNDFQRNSNVAYQTSRRKGWLNDICTHMN